MHGNYDQCTSIKRTQFIVLEVEVGKLLCQIPMILLKISDVSKGPASKGITSSDEYKLTKTSPCSVTWTCTGKRLFAFFSNSSTGSKEGA
jgi:hypothetical protein